MFLWWVLKKLSFLSKSSNEVMQSLSAILKDRSCKWFILLFTFLLWNIQMNGKYPNRDSTNVFIKICFCLKLINLDNLANTASFLPAFLHSEITWSSKLRFLPISIPSYQVRQILAIFYRLVALDWGWNCVKGLRVTKIVKQVKFEGAGTS